MRTLTFIDLFAGIGGLRLGFEIACQNCGIPANCIFTSEIKPAAIKVLKQTKKIKNLYTVRLEKVEGLEILKKLLNGLFPQE